MSVIAPLRSRVAGASSGPDWEALTAIFDPAINLAWVDRRIDPQARSFVLAALAEKPGFFWQGRCEHVDDLVDMLPLDLRRLPGFSHWAADLALQVQAFQILFEPAAVGIRVHALTQAMCPRFHVDQVPVRMVSTYAGAGTEWLAHADVDRGLLGRPLNGQPDPLARPEKIQRLPTGSIALLKGEAWMGNENRGLVHRSPPVTDSTPRWVATLDWLDA